MVNARCLDFSESAEPILGQQKYISETFAQDTERMERVIAIANELGEMSQTCRLSVCIPAYRESGIIGNTLKHYTAYQVFPDGTPFDPSRFEINILVNRPNANTEPDLAMMAEIRQFKSDHPEYRINVSQVVYDFVKGPIIGTIFKDIADATVLRNLSRNASADEKSRLILRTAGADVEALNPLFIARTIRAFSDRGVIAHRGATRLPPELLQSFPLLHVMQTFAIFLLRQYHGGHTTNGPFSYTAEAYASVNGFNPKKALGEEIDLAQRLWVFAQASS